MNVRDLTDVLENEVQRPDMSYKYLPWINRALRKIQQDYSWNCMRHAIEVTITSGTGSVALPSDFKELTPEKSPVMLKSIETAGRTRFYPSRVGTFEDISRKDAYLLYPYAPQAVVTDKYGIPVYLSIDDQASVWTLNIVGTTNQDITYRVSYFRFLPQLKENTDENFLTREYEEMVEVKLKATAFMSLNDPVAGDFEALYVRMAQLARATDELRRFQGRTLRIGGS